MTLFLDCAGLLEHMLFNCGPPNLKGFVHEFILFHRILNATQSSVSYVHWIGLDQMFSLQSVGH